MSNVLNLRKEITAFNKSERFDAYSKVIINVNDDLSYEEGDNTGRTLTLSCPWGTQAMAKNILSQMRGFFYQPYTAGGAILDPASELGDGINVNGVYSGIYRMDTTFNSHCSTDISAPSDEEIDYEYQYRSKQQREVARKNKYFSSQLRIHSNQITAEVSERKYDIKYVKSTLDMQSNQIVAKVNKNYGSSSTFGWALETDSWRIFAGSSTVLKATESGLEIKGKITATGGDIGGFTINNNNISSNGQTWGGTNSTGVYIGTNGIQLGKYFKVDSKGNLTATSGTIGGFTISSNNISYNGQTWNGTNSKGIYFGTSGIQLGNKFKVDSNGNLTATGGTFSGKIDATGGTIGGFTINSDNISYNGQSWNGTTTTGIYFGTNGIQLGKNFKVDSKGNLTATSGNFKGKITATDGTIGGFAINSNNISHNGQTWNGTNLTGVYIGTNGIQLGKYFKVDSKGNLTATSGTIGGFTINSNNISYNGQTWGGTNSTGIYFGTSGIQLGKKFKVDSNGNLTATNGTFSGKITATGGTIGGFTINSNYISYNGQKWNGTNSAGIYFGPNGIQLGKHFKVDAKGNLTANNGTFRGTVDAGNISYGYDSDGNYHGTLSGYALDENSISGSRLEYNTVTTDYTASGINLSLGYADFANDVFNDLDTAPAIRCNGIRVQETYFSPVTLYYTNAGGETSVVTVLGHRE